MKIDPTTTPVIDEADPTQPRLPSPLTSTDEFRRPAPRPPERPWVMPLADAALAFLAFALAYYVRYELEILRPLLEINRAPFAPYLPYYAVFAAWLFFNYRGSGLYQRVRGRALMEEIYSIINGVANATVVVMALSFIFQPLVFSRLMILYVAAFAIALHVTARVVQRGIEAQQRAKGIGLQRVLLVGADEVGRAVLRTVIARRELGYTAVGYLDDDPDRGSVDLGRVRGLGGLDNLESVIRQYAVDMVIITLRWSNYDRILELVEIARDAGADVRVVPDVFQLNMKQVQVENLDGIPLLGVHGHVRLQGTSRLMKRAIDLGLVIVASPVLLLVFLTVALAIRLETPGPIFYRQKRVGEHGREFYIYKFRSMIPDADKYRDHLVKSLQLDPRHPKIPDDPRITRVGRFIRRTSLDELPNLINVIRGQMSLVGPRPPTPDEVALYESWHMQRLQTMPGMTGLWQISGRSDVPFDEMCLLDIYYIENWSIQLDAQILMMTVPRVLLRQGAY
ncbi:MAG: sugar transferase [bacterium]|nr:sugar transferase [bacterium]